MRRRHSMPFGAEYLGDGRTRFRLWAPGAERIELELRTPRGTTAREMSISGDGWFESVTNAPAGTRYRYRLQSGQTVPDPASRYNPDDVHGDSVVVDPAAYEWHDGRWQGRPWHETVIYELHVGAATPEGTFRALTAKLDHYVGLGVSAIELMPVADFPGRRNWGYDGVLPYAPEASYGTPHDLKHFVDAAHARGLMVFVDVVYNHFGPEGNYLWLYAPAFFTNAHHTPWGAAINYDRTDSRTVREFFIHNALYWIEEFHVDGLRFDAVHTIIDESRHHVLNELAERVRAAAGRERHVHLVLEDDANRASLLERSGDGRVRWYDAQWNDDWHHALHVLLTGERDGYYADYADDPTGMLARCLVEGYAYQGEVSAHRGGEPRGEPSAALPPTAFVSFLQNHDQVGNRAGGERIAELAKPEALRAATCALLLAPQIPLLFMGEEFGLETPFFYFCDFEGELADAVREGRRNEFRRFAGFSLEQVRKAIPDPGAPQTFERSKLPWNRAIEPAHRKWLALYGRLLQIRRDRIAPLLDGARGHCGRATVHGEGALSAVWKLRDRAQLELRLNLGTRAVSGLPRAAGATLHAEPPAAAARIAGGELPPHSAAVHLAEGGAS